MENNMSSMPSAPVSGGKGGMIAALVGLLLVGLVVGYMIGKSGTTPTVSQTATPSGINQSNDTTGWKTYKSAEYGFEFKYPAQLIADGAWITLPQGEGTGDSFKVLVNPASWEGCIGADDSESDTVVIDGIASEHEVCIYDSHVTESYVIEYLGNDFLIYVVYQKAATRDRIIANQILSTFRFTK